MEFIGEIPIRLDNIVSIGQLKDLIKNERVNRLEEEKKIVQMNLFWSTWRTRQVSVASNSRRTQSFSVCITIWK